MQKYGQIIKEIRQEKGYTLKTFAEKTGLSVGFLSKVERGVNNPSFTNLQKICYALEVSSSVLEERESQESRKEQVCFRKADRSLIYAYDSGIKMEAFYPDNGLFRISVMTLSGKNSSRTTARHAQNEFGIVLRGTLRIGMNDKEYLLEAEDGILISAGTEHFTEKVGSEDCVSIWIKYG